MRPFYFVVALPLAASGCATTLPPDVIASHQSESAQLKATLGLLLLAAGVLVLTGFDKVLEDAMVRSAPSWLVDLTTRF
jgi:hypothetical protein